MTFTLEQTVYLRSPLTTDHVRRNPRGFDYIEGWWAISEANRIFGFDGWNRQLMRLELLGEPREVDGKMRVAYMAQVRITVGDIIRDGCGYGSGIDRDLGQAHESAIKEAETDAMKRALMTFGNPFGLALYDKARANVAAPGSVTPSTPPKAANGSTIDISGRFNANQCKTQSVTRWDTGEITTKAILAAKLAHEMTDILEVTELLAWKRQWTAEIETWPPKWEEKMWEDYEIHMADVRAVIERDHPAEEVQEDQPAY